MIGSRHDNDSLVPLKARLDEVGKYVNEGSITAIEAHRMTAHPANLFDATRKPPQLKTRGP